MRRPIVTLAALVLLGGCAVGPSTRVSPVVHPVAARTDTAPRPAVRAFLDSLTLAREAEVYIAQAGISIPLFTGGKLLNEQRAARARADQAKSLYEQTVLTALGEASDALAGVRLNRDQIVAQATQAQALRRAYDLAEQRYRSGVSSYLEVLDAQRGLFNAELALRQVQRQYLVATVQLYRALGGSWAEARGNSDGA